jgi:hypothetical protein
MINEHKTCLVCKHEGPCVVRSGHGCAYLADGTKVVVCRDATTKGRAWLEVKPQTMVHADSVTSDSPGEPFNEWISKNRDELAKYPDQFVAIHPNEGVVVADANEERFSKCLLSMIPIVRHQLLTTHTSLYANAPDSSLAPPPPHDPMGLEMCPGITPPHDHDDPLTALKRCVEDIKANKDPDVTPEMLALAEDICNDPHAHLEDPQEWARRLAREIVDSGEREERAAGRHQASTWVKVQKRSEWGYDLYFYLEGEKERHLSGSGAPGTLKSAVVRWPDGFSDRLAISADSEWRRAYEQGPGSYAVQSPVLEIGVVLHGVATYLNLEHFEIDPDSLEWEKIDG